MIITKEILQSLRDNEFLSAQSIIKKFDDERIPERLAFLHTNGYIDQHSLGFFITERGKQAFNHIIGI